MLSSADAQDRINDFVIKLANVNGTGSASANTLLMKSMFRMGIPVMGKNYFPSNIQGLPTWYEIRVTREGYVARSGRIDIMVNNTGFTHRNGSLLDVSEDNFDLIAAVNMKAIYYSTLAVVPIMERQGGGSIITTASTAGLRPRPGLTWYNASKGWAITATKSMAVELAPKNIRVNCICPVAAETPMLGLFLGDDTPERRAQFKATIPLGRFSTPLDIANAALWLASDEATFITGVALEVDGGRCI